MMMPRESAIPHIEQVIDSGWIPFEFITPNAPIVTFDALVNGSELLRLTLDTGNASGLHVSEASARRLGLDFSEPLEIPEGKHSYGDDFTPSAYEATVQSLSIGDWSMNNFELTISSYVDYLAESLDAPWEANFGRELMKDLRVVIDYPGSRLRFSSLEEQKSTTSNFRIGDAPWIIVRARILDGPPNNFILDTGAGGTMVDAALAAEIGLELGEEVDVQGATGMGKARFSHPTSVKVGRKRVTGLRVVVSDFVGQLSAGAGIELSGIVGYDFFKDSVVTIDYKRRRIGFK